MTILYHPRAFKFLRKIPQKEARKIIRTIEKLSTTPIPTNLDIKELINTKRSLRLRIGNVRVIFEVDNQKKMLYVNDIDFRGNIY